MNHSIEKSVRINSSPPKVWDYLTKPELISEWTGEPEMEIEIHTNWIVGGPIVIKGFHHAKFENKGIVMQFDPYRIIQYSHLNSVSKLPDMPENYSIITFQLIPDNRKTRLTLRIENFPTETIFKHLDFYWEGTLTILKNNIEKK